MRLKERDTADSDDSGVRCEQMKDEEEQVYIDPTCHRSNGVRLEVGGRNNTVGRDEG